MTERVLVIGAGMAGLFTALALGGEGRRLDILERDPPAPAGGADEAFADWNRRGVGHLRHSHAFLARLRNLVLDHHPALLDELRAAGCQEMKFADGLPAASKDRYRPEPGDEILTVITSRRTTLELVMRRYVERMPGVTLHSNVNVTGLLGGLDAEGRFVCEGLRVKDGETEREERADIVIDAAGRTSQGFDWLAEHGVTWDEESEDAGILYYTRHWRLLPGQTPPERGPVPGAGDMGFIKYGVFPAARALAYQGAVDRDIRPYFRDMRTQDRQAIRRARNTLDPAYRPRFKARLMKSFAEDALTPAIRSDPALLRAFMRGFHMLEPSSAWLKRPATLASVLRAWATPRALKRKYYPPKLGPDRAEMFAALALSATADAERLGLVTA